MSNIPTDHNDTSGLRTHYTLLQNSFDVIPAVASTLYLPGFLVQRQTPQGFALDAFQLAHGILGPALTGPRVLAPKRAPVHEHT